VNRMHEYETHVVWTSNSAHGTACYQTYGREYEIRVAGKPTLHGSADPVFRGRADYHNPEDLFVAAVSACHMLTYLALAARNGVRVVSYEDRARGTLRVCDQGGGSLSSIELRPVVTLAHGMAVTAAADLHLEAANRCFLTNSCRVPITHMPEIRTLVRTNTGGAP